MQLLCCCWRWQRCGCDHGYSHPCFLPPTSHTSTTPGQPCQIFTPHLSMLPFMTSLPPKKSHGYTDQAFTSPQRATLSLITLSWTSTFARLSISMTMSQTATTAASPIQSYSPSFDASLIQDLNSDSVAALSWPLPRTLSQWGMVSLLDTIGVSCFSGYT